MRLLRIAVLLASLGSLVACGGGSGSSSSINPPLPAAQTAPVNLTLRDMPPMGVTMLSFQATITGIAMQPGNVALVTSPLTLEMRLMKTWFTATVAAKLNSLDFTINGLPGLLTSAGINSMQVTTSSQTEFDNVSAADALNVGDTVSLRGPMFAASGNPALIASKVRKR